jgi:hypothetical protein
MKKSWGYISFPDQKQKKIKKENKKKIKKGKQNKIKCFFYLLLFKHTQIIKCE